MTEVTGGLNADSGEFANVEVVTNTGERVNIHGACWDASYGRSGNDDVENGGLCSDCYTVALEHSDCADPIIYFDLAADVDAASAPVACLS